MSGLRHMVIQSSAMPEMEEEVYAGEIRFDKIIE